MQSAPAFVTPLRALTAHKPVQWAVLAGVGVGLLLVIVDNPFIPLARLLLAWDVGAATYVAAAFWLLHAATPAEMELHAARARGARHFVLAISLIGVVASICVVGFELRIMNAEPDSMQALRVAFVLLTVAISWLFVHTSFASHYAYEYYGRQPGASGKRGGLIFPGGEEPNFLDIWHFSVVIGLALATADVNISSKSIRRIATVHGIGAFLFNTIILAATLNFVSEFLRPGA